MPDARDVNVYYHITGEGFSGEHASASHRTTGGTINGNAGAPRQFDATNDFVCGPLAPGVWEAVFADSTGVAGVSVPVTFSQGATAAAAAPSKTTSPFVPDVSAATAPPLAPSWRFIVPKGSEFIGFIATATLTINFSLRLVHAEK